MLRLKEENAAKPAGKRENRRQLGDLEGGVGMQQVRAERPMRPGAGKSNYLKRHWTALRLYSCRGPGGVSDFRSSDLQDVLLEEGRPLAGG